MSEPIYQRVLLKISGEALISEKGFGIDSSLVQYIATEVKEVKELGIEIGIVMGGGNIFRGFPASAQGIDRVLGDQMGMLATVINALALQNYLEKSGILTRVQSAITIEELAEPFIRRRAIRHLEKGRVVIFAAGTGNPYFTTDTAAALRAIQIGAEAVLKGTRVDGIYDADPELDENASKYDCITYLEVVRKGLKVMDSTAVTLCMENKLPIVVFKLTEKGNFKRLILGENIGTKVVGDKDDQGDLQKYRRKDEESSGEYAGGTGED